MVGYVSYILLYGHIWQNVNSVILTLFLGLKWPAEGALWSTAFCAEILYKYSGSRFTRTAELAFVIFSSVHWLPSWVSSSASAVLVCFFHVCTCAVAGDSVIFSTSHTSAYAFELCKYSNCCIAVNGKIFICLIQLVVFACCSHRTYKLKSV